MLAKASDEQWAAENYFRESDIGTGDYEYMTIRVLDVNGPHADNPRRILARVYPVRDSLGLSSFNLEDFHYGRFEKRFLERLFSFVVFIL